jgi:CheY-like chemotaxis protein
MLKMRFELLDGYEIIVAEDGEAGCAKARSDRPDLILMDLDLPVVDGWEATRRLKADAATSLHTGHCYDCHVGLARKGACRRLRRF